MAQYYVSNRINVQGWESNDQKCLSAQHKRVSLHNSPIMTMYRHMRLGPLPPAIPNTLDEICNILTRGGYLAQGTQLDVPDVRAIKVRRTVRRSLVRDVNDVADFRILSNECGGAVFRVVLTHYLYFFIFRIWNFIGLQNTLSRRVVWKR